MVGGQLLGFAPQFPCQFFFGGRLRHPIDALELLKGWQVPVVAAVDTQIDRPLRELATAPRHGLGADGAVDEITCAGDEVMGIVPHSRYVMAAVDLRCGYLRLQKAVMHIEAIEEASFKALTNGGEPSGYRVKIRNCIHIVLQCRMSRFEKETDRSPAKPHSI